MTHVSNAEDKCQFCNFISDTVLVGLREEVQKLRFVGGILLTTLL
jgi:hypothetical protein